MIWISRRGFVESLMGQGWDIEQVEEVKAHLKESRWRGLYASCLKLMERRDHCADELKREKLLHLYGICMNKLVRL